MVNKVHMGHFTFGYFILSCQVLHSSYRLQQIFQKLNDAGYVLPPAPLFHRSYATVQRHPLANPECLLDHFVNFSHQMLQIETIPWISNVYLYICVYFLSIWL